MNTASQAGDRLLDLAFTPKSFALIYSGDFSGFTLRPQDSLKIPYIFKVTFKNKRDAAVDDLRKVLVAFDEAFQRQGVALATSLLNGGGGPEEFKSKVMAALEHAVTRVSMRDKVDIEATSVASGNSN